MTFFFKEIQTELFREKGHHVCNLIQKEFTYLGTNGTGGGQTEKERETNREIKIKAK